MSFLDFDHVEMCVEELEQSVLFYLSTLGFWVIAARCWTSTTTGGRCRWSCSSSRGGLKVTLGPARQVAPKAGQQPAAG